MSDQHAAHNDGPTPRRAREREEKATNLRHALVEVAIDHLAGSVHRTICQRHDSPDRWDRALVEHVVRELFHLPFDEHAALLAEYALTDEAQTMPHPHAAKRRARSAAPDRKGK